jgi:predicted RNA-binding protein (virulence factor B family)
MVEIGQYHVLRVIKELSFGAYLDADGTEILLPKKDIPENMNIGDSLKVFVYKDSEARPVATTRKPKITLNHFASLKVTDINKYGAFLEWGIENELLMPFREKPQFLSPGDHVVVMLYLDRVSGRLAATSRVERHLRKIADESLQEGDEADLLVYEKTNMGYKAIVNQMFTGVIYNTDIFQKVEIGDLLKGYIARLREDGKIDLTLRRAGLDELSSSKEKILAKLAVNKGFLPLHDKSGPEEIKKALEVSKKTFKRSIGMLYKEKKIEITDFGIKLI